MKKTAKRSDLSQAGSWEQRAREVMSRGWETLHDAVVKVGLTVLQAMLEEDRAALCGRRYTHDAERRATRAGYTMGELSMCGRRVSVARPRVRSRSNRELRLPTWERFAGADPLTPRAVEQILLGVSTRQYERSLEPMNEAVMSRGASKSAVSRRFVEASRERLAEMMCRDLSELSICVIMVDGIYVGDHVVLVALGIDERARKHVLGLYEGATENRTACTGLLADLVARGLRTARSMLFVIDGSKALARAIRDVFGSRALIQRCQVHKRRNVLEHLPESMRQTVGRTISAAYHATEGSRAQRMLEALAQQLEKSHPAAAASLREGLDETLTVMRLNLPRWLTQTLTSTNPIEHINGRIRKLTHNVKRWDSGEMVLRWLATAVIEASVTFKRLRGYEAMPKLVFALRTHDQKLTGTIDPSTEAA